MIFSSYLHCDWKTQEELEVTDKRVNQKLKRYHQKQSQNHSYMMNVSYIRRLGCAAALLLVLLQWFYFWRPEKTSINARMHLYMCYI